MKKILLATLLMLSLTDYAQTYTTEDKALTGVIECQGKTKAQIFSAISKWISINYNSGKSVTQLSDAEGGNIVIRGINEITYPNNTKILYPNMKSISETSIMKFNHLVEINVKDNKYRIVYKIVDIYYEPAAVAYLTAETIKMNFDCINLNGVPDSTILSFSDYIDTNLKKGLVGKEKRDKYKESIKPMYDELNSNIVTEMKTTILSISKSITAPSDSW